MQARIGEHLIHNEVSIIKQIPFLILQRRLSFYTVHASPKRGIDVSESQDNYLYTAIKSGLDSTG